LQEGQNCFALDSGFATERASQKGPYTQSAMQVYERTKEVIRRFLAHKLTFPACIAALDAALASLIPSHAGSAAV